MDYVKLHCCFCNDEHNVRILDRRTEEIKELEKYASAHFKKGILSKLKNSLKMVPRIFTDDEDRKQYQQVISTVNLCDDCIVECGRLEVLNLKSQLKYFQTITKFRKENDSGSPWKNITDLAFYKLKGKEEMIRNQLQHLEKLLPSENPEISFMNKSSRSSNQSGPGPSRSRSLSTNAPSSSSTPALAQEEDEEDRTGGVTDDIKESATCQSPALFAAQNSVDSAITCCIGSPEQVIGEDDRNESQMICSSDSSGGSPLFPVKASSPPSTSTSILTDSINPDNTYNNAVPGDQSSNDLENLDNFLGTIENSFAENMELDIMQSFLDEILNPTTTEFGQQTLSTTDQYPIDLSNQFLQPLDNSNSSSSHGCNQEQLVIVEKGRNNNFNETPSQPGSSGCAIAVNSYEFNIYQQVREEAQQNDNMQEPTRMENCDENNKDFVDASRLPSSPPPPGNQVVGDGDFNVLTVSRDTASPSPNTYYMDDEDDESISRADADNTSNLNESERIVPAGTGSNGGSYDQTCEKNTKRKRVRSGAPEKAKLDGGKHQLTSSTDNKDQLLSLSHSNKSMIEGSDSAEENIHVKIDMKHRRDKTSRKSRRVISRRKVYTPSSSPFRTAIQNPLEIRNRFEQRYNIGGHSSRNGPSGRSVSWQELHRTVVVVKRLPSSVLLALQNLEKKASVFTKLIEEG